MSGSSSRFGGDSPVRPGFSASTLTWGAGAAGGGSKVGGGSEDGALAGAAAGGVSRVRPPLSCGRSKARSPGFDGLPPTSGVRIQEPAQQGPEGGDHLEQGALELVVPLCHFFFFHGGVGERSRNRVRV
jgi:hypothetical protein